MSLCVTLCKKGLLVYHPGREACLMQLRGTLLCYDSPEIVPHTGEAWTVQFPPCSNVPPVLLALGCLPPFGAARLKTHGQEWSEPSVPCPAHQPAEQKEGHGTKHPVALKPTVKRDRGRERKGKLGSKKSWTPSLRKLQETEMVIWFYIRNLLSNGMETFILNKWYKLYVYESAQGIWFRF